MTNFDQLRDAILPFLLPFGVRRVAVFGSVARNEEGPESDLDLLVEFVQPKKKPMGLLELQALERDLSQLAGRRVEVVSAAALKPRLRPMIERDQVILYEAA